MRLVKTVSRKVFQLLENFNGHRFFNVILHGALHELHLHLSHELRNLLTHGFTQAVSFSSSEAGEVLRHLHNLLLVNRNAVRFFKRILHERMLINHFF